MPVGRMLDEMSSHEITEWAVYFKIRNSEQNESSGTTVQMNAIHTMAGQSTVAE